MIHRQAVIEDTTRDAENTVPFVCSTQIQLRRCLGNDEFLP